MSIRRWPTALVFAVLALPWLLAGCSSDHAVNPQATPGLAAAGSNPRPGGQAVPQGLPLGSTPVSVSRFIQASTGGTISGGNVTVIFGKASLPRDTTVTLTTNPATGCFQVGPAGLPLKTPATIQIANTLLNALSNVLGKLDIFRIGSTGNVSLGAKLVGILNPQLTAVTSTLGSFAVGDNNPLSEGIFLITSLTTPGSSSAFIRADAGGQIQYGRYTLTIPPGALSQDTNITIQDPGDGYLLCQLLPHGIQFNVPVTLQMDLTGLGVPPDAAWTIFWYNDATNGWEDQIAVFTPYSLTASLHHFSNYAGGRAGW